MPPSSWAKRTGFRPKFSGETNASDSGQIVSQPKPKDPGTNLDLEAGRARIGPAVNGEKASPAAAVAAEKERTVMKRRDSDGGGGAGANTTYGQAAAAAEPVVVPPQSRRPSRNEEMVDVLPQTVDDDGFGSRHSRMKYELRDSPGLGESFIYLDF